MRSSRRRVTSLGKMAPSPMKGKLARRGNLARQLRKALPRQLVKDREAERSSQVPPNPRESPRESPKGNLGSQAQSPSQEQRTRRKLRSPEMNYLLRTQTENVDT